MATPQDDERAETSEATYQRQDDGHGQSRKNTVLPGFTDLPRADAYRRIDFERVEVRPGVAAGTYILVVSGTAPYANMRVELVPLVYVRRPKYWGIEVVGSLPGGIGLPAEAPYTVSLPLDGFVGTEGIEVLGAERTERRRVPPECRCWSWAAWHDHMPPGPPTLHVTGTCRFPTEGYVVALRPHEPQGINPADYLLDLVVRAPTGPVADKVTDVDVRYDEDTKMEYDTVTILDYASVKVEEVS